MKIHFTLLCLTLLCGCVQHGRVNRSTVDDSFDSPQHPGPHQTFRQVVGRPMARAGTGVGKAGTLCVMAGGIYWPLAPVGIAAGLTCYMFAAPLYFGGSWIAGDKTEHGAWDL